ncbi:UDP-N-acetylmuramoyl-tripeptide--D-alanyl-D-alanine ligase [Parapontixanthobacter aurantiacus]|uniref:UDP-N-acetylmuramoyl-tripeptide--D-alanyl-D- alanine ligase n=1 Tax=Parapontixanthobacter aurantiacus TaxID=1463599 RepID=UPI001925FB14
MRSSFGRQELNAVSALRQWPTTPLDSVPLALWSASDIAAATGGRASADFEVAGVETDSRYIRNGDLFVALKGETMDGHRFLEQAFAAGAAAALVDREVLWPHILVEDTSEALEALAAAARERTRAKFVGVTGSVGKTGVKEAIFAALERSSRGAAHRSIKSYNNHVGVPLSLARMPARSKFAVFEMGMNHAGEISELTRFVKPDVAVITTIAPAHIENLGSMEAIAAAKAEIFEGVKPGGVAVIPADSPHFAQLRDAAKAQHCHILSFGRSEHADMRLLDAIPQASGGSLMTAQCGSGRLVFSVAEPGEHWVMNALAVMAAVLAVGGDLASAGLALAEMGGLAGRGARHRIAVLGGKALVIDESYNANPASMRATLAQLGQTPAARRIAVLGSMKELGDFSDRFHAGLAEPICDAKVDYAVLVGEEMHALVGEFHRILGKAGQGALGKVPTFAHCRDAGEAAGLLADYGIVGGDAILVKGSNSVGLGKVISELTRRDD